jgi:hypothetical protein
MALGVIKHPISFWAKFCLVTTKCFGFFSKFPEFNVKYYFLPNLWKLEN